MYAKCGYIVDVSYEVIEKDGKEEKKFFVLDFHSEDEHSIRVDKNKLCAILKDGCSGHMDTLTKTINRMEKRKKEERVEAGVGGYEYTDLYYRIEERIDETMLKCEIIDTLLSEV